MSISSKSGRNVQRQKSTPYSKREGGTKMIAISEAPAQSKKPKKEKKSKKKDQSTDGASTDSDSEVNKSSGRRDSQSSVGSDVFTPTITPAFQVSEDMRIGKKRRVSGAYDSSSDAASAASTSPYQRRISTPQINLPLYGDPNQINPFAEMNQSYSTQTTMQIGIAQPNEPLAFDPSFNPAVPPPSSPQKQERVFTKKQMQECSELFQRSERLTKVDKAQIIQFLSGHQENPTPHEGPIKRFPLYDETESEMTPFGERRVQVEYYFELNYETGQAQKLRYVPSHYQN